MASREREITEPVDLCTPSGRLNPDAVGWTRTPLHRCNLRGWGRTKRWEYWCITTPTHLVAVTVSSLDYLGVNNIYFLEYGGREINRNSVLPLARGVTLPTSLGGGPSSTRGAVTIDLSDGPDGTRIQFSCNTADGPLTGDLTVALPPGHETLGVVVPWSDRKFQYTAKHTARPASGTARIGEQNYDFTGGWGVLDHGRGRWPALVRWNWGRGVRPHRRPRRRPATGRQVDGRHGHDRERPLRRRPAHQDRHGAGLDLRRLPRAAVDSHTRLR